MVAQMYSMWGQPGWAMVLCALLGPAGFVGTIVKGWWDSRLKRIELDAQAEQKRDDQKAQSQQRDAGRLDEMGRQIGELREHVGALQATVHLVCQMGLIEINSLRAQLSLPPITRWPPDTILASTQTTVTQTTLKT